MQRNILYIALCIILSVVLAGCPSLKPAGAFRFIVLGDGRATDGGINEEIMAEMRDAIIAEDVDLILFTGDLVTYGEVEALERWVEAFKEPLEDAGIDVYPCRGNHDKDIDAWNTVFSGEHALPGNGPEGEVNLTYSFVQRNTLFISLDTWMPDRRLRVNQEWLDEQLENNTRRRVFVFGHHPAFAVYHDSALSRHEEERDAFWDSLGGGGVSAYFCGHDHFYNLTRIPDSSGNIIHQCISGAAGAPLHDWSGEFPDDRVEGIDHFKNFGYVVVEVGTLKVKLTAKERTAQNTYEATGDTYEFSLPQ